MTLHCPEIQCGAVNQSICERETKLTTSFCPLNYVSKLPDLQLEPWHRTKWCFSISQYNNKNLAHCCFAFGALFPGAFTIVSEFTKVSLKFWLFHVGKQKKIDFSWTVILKWSFLGNQTFSLLQVAFFAWEKEPVSSSKDGASSLMSCHLLVQFISHNHRIIE